MTSANPAPSATCVDKDDELFKSGFANAFNGTSLLPSMKFTTIYKKMHEGNAKRKLDEII